LKPIDRTEIFNRFQNKWVALTDDDKVISWGFELDEVIEKAKKKGIPNPIFTKIPSQEKDRIL